MTGDRQGPDHTAGREVARSAWDLVGTVGRTAPVHLVAYLLAMAGEALAPVAVAWLTKLIIDGLAGSSPGSRLVPVAVALAATGMVAAVLPHTTGYLGNEIGRRFVLQATDRLFAATVRLPGLRRFEDPHYLDRLRLAQEGASMGGATVAQGFGTGRSVITVVGFVGSLLVISPVMTVVVLAAAVPALVAHLQLSRWRAGMLWRLSPTERWQLLYSNLLSNVDAAKEIRLFGSGGFLRSRMMWHLRKATVARRRMGRRELSIESVLAVLGAAVAGGGLVWAIGAAVSGRLSPGDITLFVAAVGSVQGALSSLVTGVAGVHHGLLLFGHCRAVVRSAPDLPVPARPVQLPPLRHGIELRDVWFRYSQEHPWVLKGASLLIPAGCAVGLVGLNGAGKSTLVKLLCRFYDPDHGAIYWDGIDLRQVDPAQLRARISGVFQDHMSYDLSAQDNIVVGDVTAGDDPQRLRTAARQAGMDDTLRALPRGYDTLLTRMFFSEQDKQDPSTGVVLSGGQWQRIALARAYFRDRRDLMILDEPSAGLDPQAEAELHAQTRHHRAGRTSLLISHRLNTIRDANLLIVLDDGAVAEQGTHQHLVAAGGVYARLFDLQAAGYQQDAPAGEERERATERR